MQEKDRKKKSIESKKNMKSQLNFTQRFIQILLQEYITSILNTFNSTFKKVLVRESIETNLIN